MIFKISRAPWHSCVFPQRRFVHVPSQKPAVLTFVPPIEETRQPVGAFEVEKGGNSEDEEHADQ